MSLKIRKGDTVEIRNGGVIQTATFGSPDSGNIRVEGDKVIVKSNALIRTLKGHLVTTTTLNL